MASLGFFKDNICTTRINKEKKFKIKFQVLLKFAQILPDYMYMKGNTLKLCRIFLVPMDILNFGIQLFLKTTTTYQYCFKKSSNVFISYAFLESLNHQIVWLQRKYFALLFMKSLKLIISNLCANSNLFEMACKQQNLKVYTRNFIQILKLSKRNRHNSLA